MRRSRRKTFLVDFVSAPAGRHAFKGLEVLASGEAAIRDFYETRGYVVGTIKPKPRRKTGWKINEAAIQEACEFLGLTLPIYFDHSSGYKNAGSYGPRFGWALPQAAPEHLRRAPLVHRIMVRRFDDAEAASRTLWHELAHAMQAEREMAGGGIRAYNRHVDAESVIPYKQRPSEIEAREHEELHDWLPLTIAV